MNKLTFTITNITIDSWCTLVSTDGQRIRGTIISGPWPQLGDEIQVEVLSHGLQDFLNTGNGEILRLRVEEIF